VQLIRQAGKKGKMMKQKQQFEGETLKEGDSHANIIQTPLHL